MKSLVTCISATQLPPSAPAEIVYIPEGENTITPYVNGKPKTVTVRVPGHKGHEIAARLQTALQRRQRNTVRPFLDFEHKNGSASALPQSFRYESGKGIMLAVDWTGSGRKSIENRDFSYFSPTFLIDDNGEPADLPEKGAVGALVNEPAFRNLERIAASHAVADELSGEDLLKKTLTDESGIPERVAAAHGERRSEFEGLSGIRLLEAAIRADAGESPSLIKASMCPDVQGNVQGNVQGLSGTDLVAACLTVEAGETIRKDTRKAIEKMVEQSKPSAKELLDALADEIVAAGKARTFSEAKTLAAVQRPDLFQRSQDDMKAFEKAHAGKVEATDNRPGLSTLAAFLNAESIS